MEVSLSRDYRLKRKISYHVLPASPCGSGVGYLLIKEFTDESFREVVKYSLCFNRFSFIIRRTRLRKRWTAFRASSGTSRGVTKHSKVTFVP